MVIRNLQKNDNFEEVAQLIYLTDPYIYPYWFNNNIQEAKKVLAELIKKKTIFYYKNIIIAKIKDEIVGYALCVSNKYKIENKLEDYKKINFFYQYTIENYIENLYQFNISDKVSLMGICVLPQYRRHEIGFELMNNVFKKYGNKEYVLEMLADNVSAYGMYKKCGFKKVGEGKGFAGYGLPDVAIFEMKKEKTIN